MATAESEREPIKVLIFHGYLLRGTGSNVYNANLAQALARLGHEVHLLCQDHEVNRLGWIDAVGSWSDGELAIEGREDGSSPGDGTVTAYIPEIGGLLPVYVEDRYAGFRAKPFPALSDDELERYIDSNVAAVTEVVERAGGVDAALANHTVMGPLILARAGLQFAAKVHGSALSYTVAPHERFLPHAREGIDAARGILVGSRHTAEQLWEVLGDAALAKRTRLGPPGVDLERFAPRDPGRSAVDPLADVAEAIAASTEADPDGAADAFGRDPAGAVRALAAYAAAPGPRVAFVGKLIVSKGVDLLLAAWPLVVVASPGARLLICGFGSYRAALEDLWAAIAVGDLETAREIAAAGRALEQGEAPAAPEPLAMLSAFLADPPAAWAEGCRAAAGSVRFAGRLEHDEVADLLVASDAMVVPSTFPEAFGMVAAEAAATGALPICADHSGLAEVAEALDADLPEPARGLAAFPLGPGAVEAIAERLVGWLGLEPEVRRQASESLAATVRRLWSWERVAAGVIEASQGRLEDLPRVPDPSPDRH